MWLRVMKLGSHTHSRPKIICTTRMKTITATLAVIPGIALAGEVEIRENTSISEAKDFRPSFSMTSSTAILCPWAELSS